MDKELRRYLLVIVLIIPLGLLASAMIYDMTVLAKRESKIILQCEETWRGKEVDIFSTPALNKQTAENRKTSN